MGKIFFILGKSSSGKDTIFQKIKENNELGLKTVVGYTTRPMRENEVDGEEYFFVDRDRLEELKNDDKVIESRDYNTVHGIWSYFTVDDGQIGKKLLRRRQSHSTFYRSRTGREIKTRSFTRD